MTKLTHSKEEWLGRYAAHLQNKGGVDAANAPTMAEGGWDLAVDANGTEEAALADMTAEEAADEEMRCWGE